MVRKVDLCKSYAQEVSSEKYKTFKENTPSCFGGGGIARNRIDVSQKSAKIPPKY